MQGQRHMDGMRVMPEAPAACVPVAGKLGGGPEHCTSFPAYTVQLIITRPLRPA